MNPITVPYRPNIKTSDKKLLTPLMLHKSPATSIKAKAQIHNNKTLERKEFICDIDTIVPAIKETTV